MAPAAAHVCLLDVHSSGHGRAAGAGSKLSKVPGDQVGMLLAQEWGCLATRSAVVSCLQLAPVPGGTTALWPQKAGMACQPEAAR